MDAFIGLGSNLGDPLLQLRFAARALATHGVVKRRSAIYQTVPVGGPPQPDYLNAALWLATPCDPYELLDVLMQIEARAGRVRDPALRNTPRELDLDVLLLGARGDVIVVSPELVVPHPRLHLRAFALRPLLDLSPDLVHPALSVPMRELLDGVLMAPESAEPPPRPIAWL